MHFGLFNLNQKRDPRTSPKKILNQLLEAVRLSEDIGMDRCWLAEHHFTDYCLCSSPLIAAAFLAGSTKKMVFAPGILVLPLYEPIRLTEDYGLLDLMTSGRIELGIGIGYQSYEFNRFGVPMNENLPRTMEILDIMEMGFSEGRINYEGKYYKINDAPITVRPSSARPPLYFAGALTNSDVPQRAIRKKYIPFVYHAWSGLDVLLSMRGVYDKAAIAEGVDPKSVPMAIERFIYITDSKADARVAAEQFRYSVRSARALRYDYATFDGTSIVEAPAKDEPSLDEIMANTIIGDAETCAERLVKEIRSARLTHIACLTAVGSLDHQHVLKSIERFGKSVMPLVTEELKKM